MVVGRDRGEGRGVESEREGRDQGGSFVRRGIWVQWVDRKGGRAILIGVAGVPWGAAFGLLLQPGVFLSS